MLLDTIINDDEAFIHSCGKVALMHSFQLCCGINVLQLLSLLKRYLTTGKTSGSTLENVIDCRLCNVGLHTLEVVYAFGYT